MEKKYVKEITALKRASKLKKNHGHVAFYSVIFQDGDKLVEKKNGNTACHAGLSFWDERRTPIAVFNALGSIAVDDKVALRFLEWLQNYSPYASIWHSKSAKTTLSRGIMVANTDVPSNLLAGGMFASRALWEYPSLSKVWNAFVEKGLHPDLSFYLSHFYKLSNDGSFSINTWEGHCALSGISGYSHHNYVVNFITNNRIDRPSYRETRQYSGVTATWSKNNPSVNGLNIDHKVLLAQVGEEDKKEKVNPFKKEVAKVKRLEPAIEYLVPKYRELFKKWI